MPAFLDYALAEAAKTRFDLQTLGGVKQYLNGYLQSRQRRILRSEIPRISAACHQLIRLAIARKITSWTFIARSQADSEYRLTLPPFPAGNFTQVRLQRTDHVLIEPDI